LLTQRVIAHRQTERERERERLLTQREIAHIEGEDAHTENRGREREGKGGNCW
jgi:hypothetical protein